MMEEEFKRKMVDVGWKALEMIEGYFDGSQEIDSEKIQQAFRIVGPAVKILHMNQVRTIVERSQAIRLLPYLKNDESRDEYIRITQPTVAPLLLGRPMTTEELEAKEVKLEEQPEDKRVTKKHGMARPGQARQGAA